MLAGMSMATARALPADDPPGIWAPCYPGRTEQADPNIPRPRLGERLRWCAQRAAYNKLAAGAIMPEPATPENDALTKALLEQESERVTVIGGDLRDPKKILHCAGRYLDFSEPVAVLLFAVLHFLRDDEGPQGIVLRLKEALPPGSALAVSHITSEAIGPERSRAAQRVYEGASAPAVPRTRAEITQFLDGLDLVPPGVTDIGHWHPEPGEPEIPLSFYGGVGRKP